MAFKPDKRLQAERADDHWIIRFSVMAGPCEILVRCRSENELFALAELAYDEAARIAQKFSRYRSDNIVHQINDSRGETIPIDGETAGLLRYAAECHRLSDGLLDITSGVLRRAWQFKGSEFTPDQNQIDALLELVGWDKVTLTEQSIQMLPGMEIDLGGIGKEYAVDCIAGMLFEHHPCPMMVNFGGDIRAVTDGSDAPPWRIGIENPDIPGESVGMVQLTSSAIATSGDTNRFCLVNGRRLGHILDPRTGWPVEGAPRSVTVFSGTCTKAGFLSTMAMLKGPDAEQFLEGDGVEHYCHRERKPVSVG